MSTHSVDAAEFALHFEALQELIMSEWPALDAEKLKASGGDLDEVVQQVVSLTEQTKALTHKQLRELMDLCAKPKGPSFAPDLERLEARVRELSERFKGELLPEAQERVQELRSQTEERARVLRDQTQEKVEENLLMSLLIALGFGTILGLLLGGLGRGR